MEAIPVEIEDVSPSEGWHEVNEKLINETSATEERMPDGEIDLSLDKRGDSFDPELHKVNADGTPRLGKLGYFLKLGPKSKREEKAEEVKNLACASILTGSIDGVFVGIFGEEMGAGEQKPVLVEGWKGYLDEKGIELPPIYGLILCYASVYGPKLTKPTPKSRISKFFNGFKKIFGKKFKKNKENGTS